MNVTPIFLRVQSSPKPNFPGEGTESSERLRINVPGNPGGVEYYPNDQFVREGSGNDTLRNYWLFFPVRPCLLSNLPTCACCPCHAHMQAQLTRNTNELNMNGSRGRDVTTPGFSSAPFDCQYAPATNGPNGIPCVVLMPFPGCVYYLARAVSNCVIIVCHRGINGHVFVVHVAMVAGALINATLACCT